MDENLELLNYIYSASEMGKNSLETTLTLIKDKDNKIKRIAEDILKSYEKFYKESKELINKTGGKATKSPLMTKMTLVAGIRKEVTSDNSDAAIAGMIMQGLTMGVVEISVKIDNYKRIVSDKHLKLAKEFLNFQEDSIENLKKYL